MGFNLIYCTPMSGSYLMYGSILEKCGNFWKNGRFSGRIWLDWGNTTRVDMAGLGSIGLTNMNHLYFKKSMPYYLLTFSFAC